MWRSCRKKNKDQIGENWCFICKDGGTLAICDYKDCVKAYHPACLGEDSAVVESKTRWSCKWHTCFNCQKGAKFHCFCCPNAVCGRCLFFTDFALVRWDKGLCQLCLKLALLIEKGLNVDSDGTKVDFKDRDTYEGLFMDYWEVVKKKEGLPGECVYFANDLLKKDENYRRNSYSFENGLMNQTTGESDEESNFEVSDYDDMKDRRSVTKRRKSQKQLCATERKVRKKKEFIGWGSKRLLEFLASIGKETSKEWSQEEVAAIVIGYCNENKLFHPVKKKKIVSDERLLNFIGRKSFLKNSIRKLVTAHFAENFEQSKENEFLSCPDDIELNDINENHKKQRNSLSVQEPQQKKVTPDVQKCCFVSINAENIKLVYLKRSLVEELLKQPEMFERKVVGSFVRVKCDPNDYLQKNSHQLLQVKGVTMSSNCELSAQISLQFSNSHIDLPICKLSDDNFTKEECEDLRDRVKDGLLKKPTIVEFEQKARSLHEDITKHWIARELILLQKRIDQASEKGWGREYPFTRLSMHAQLMEAILGTKFEFLERRQLLSDPLEQSRLLNELPEVIPDVEVLELAIQDPGMDDDRHGNDSLLESPVRAAQAIQDPGMEDDKHGNDSLLKSPVRAAQAVQNPGMEDDRHGNDSLLESPVRAVQAIQDPGMEDDRHGHDILLESPVRAASFQTPNSDWSSTTLAYQNGTTKGAGTSEKTNREGSISDQQSQTIAHEAGGDLQTEHHQSVLETKKSCRKELFPESTLKVDLIELSDDEQDSEDEINREALKSPLWYVMCPSGQIRGPHSISDLKQWSEDIEDELNIKVWKKGQNSENAILLTDAIHRIFAEKDQSKGSIRQESLIINISDAKPDCRNGTGNGTTGDPSCDLWYIMCPFREERGPYKMSILKEWSSTINLKTKYKVWKKGQSKETAILLKDAIALNN